MLILFFELWFFASGLCSYNFLPNTRSAPLKCIPGRPCVLQQFLNECGVINDEVIELLLPNDSAIKLNDGSKRIFASNKITLLGTPKSSTILSITANTTILKFNVSLELCPPGFVPVNETNTCNCSVTSYVGITFCNNITFEAFVSDSYWMGYRSDNSTCDNSTCENKLLSSLCRNCRSSCRRNPCILPNSTDASSKDYDEIMCSSNRTGFLCARCIENHSVFFHSRYFTCFPNHLCSMGWFFFLLSEILPITIVFICVLFFNIKLTSGAIQGFILYVQIFDSLRLSAHGYIKFQKYTLCVLHYLELMYSMLNLDFFVHDKLSFCLWEGASSLSIIAIKYVTIAYSLILVIIVIILLDKCCNRVQRMHSRIHKTTVIHGLSSFLILCYFQCTKVSLLILTPATVYEENMKVESRVVFYDGTMTFLKGKHQAYAFPVLILVSPLILLPPFLLFIYPLCYKVFSVLRIQESKFTRFICKVFPLENFKPYFDSFQSCFKDEYRYFAGLYFLYRLITLLIFAAVHSLSTYYTCIQIQLIVMLGLHSWAQLYRNKWHNRLDLYLFSVLALVNSITQCNFHGWFQPGEPKENYTSQATGVQVAMALSPFAVILAVLVWINRTTCHRWWKKVCMKKEVLERRQDDTLLLEISNGREELELSCDYNKE